LVGHSDDRADSKPHRSGLPGLVGLVRFAKFK
jgi:hypothetical protein